MAETFFTLTDYQVAAAFLKERIGSEPLIGLILGSGLNPLAEEIENPIAIPYDEVPGFPVTTVEGHIGRIISGQMSGSPILVMQGRAHYYEGYSIQQVVFPVKVMQLMGVKVL
ncbi:MAG TPA: purine-nucleoside phosphorylase, partial [Chloroflexi bacterium]|nr:purine-nucleoside phosphorylase [Chloroflexota bacterium]